MTDMFRHLVVERPLAVIDLETTGVDVRQDRIVEVGVVKFAPDDRPARYHRLAEGVRREADHDAGVRRASQLRLPPGRRQVRAVSAEALCREAGR